MTVQYTTHVLMRDGTTETYESGAKTQEVANDAALLYFKNHDKYNPKEIVKTTRGPAQ